MIYFFMAFRQSCSWLSLSARWLVVATLIILVVWSRVAFTTSIFPVQYQDPTNDSLSIAPRQDENLNSVVAGKTTTSQLLTRPRPDEEARKSFQRFLS
jgi:hypothetical protein